MLEKLLDLVEVPLPEGVVADELNQRRESIEQQLAYAGLTLDKYLEDEGQTQEEFEADLDRRVREAVAAQFVLDEVADALELGVDQNELTEHMVRRAQQSGQDPQEFANHMFEHNHVPELVAEIRRGKALAQIVEGATVTDASGNVVDLKNLRPDGSYADAEADPATRTPTRGRRPRTDPVVTRGRTGGRGYRGSGPLARSRPVVNVAGCEVPDAGSVCRAVRSQPRNSLRADDMRRGVRRERTPVAQP